MREMLRVGGAGGKVVAGDARTMNRGLRQSTAVCSCAGGVGLPVRIAGSRTSGARLGLREFGARETPLTFTSVVSHRRKAQAGARYVGGDGRESDGNGAGEAAGRGAWQQPSGPVIRDGDGASLSASASAASGTSASRVGKVPRWKVHVLIVSVSMLLCNLDRVAMGVLAVPLLKEFNIGLTSMGILQSSFLWGYLAAQIPAGIISDRRGGSSTMVAGLVLWSVATCFTAFSPYSKAPLTAAIVSRVLMGVGSSVALPAVSSAIAKKVPPKFRARCTTLSFALFNFGTVIANLCTPYVSESVGWQWSFVLYGLLGLAWSAVSIALLRRRPGGGEGASEGPAKALARTASSAGLGGQGPPGGNGSGAVAWEGPGGALMSQDYDDDVSSQLSVRKVLKKRVLLQLSVLMFAHSTIGLGYFTLQAWIPTFLAKDLGIASLRAAGLCTALVWFVTSCNTAFIGVVADRMLERGTPSWKVRKYAMTISTLVPAVCFFLISFSRSAHFSVLLMMAGLVSWSFDYAGFHPYIIDVAGDNSGTILSITNSAGIVAGIVGNILTGYLVSRSGNFNAVFRWLAGVYLVSGVLWNMFMKGDRIDVGL